MNKAHFHSSCRLLSNIPIDHLATIYRYNKDVDIQARQNDLNRRSRKKLYTADSLDPTHPTTLVPTCGVIVCANE